MSLSLSLRATRLRTLPAYSRGLANELRRPPPAMHPDCNCRRLPLPSCSLGLRYRPAHFEQSVDRCHFEGDFFYYHSDLRRCPLRSSHIIMYIGSPIAPLFGLYAQWRTQSIFVQVPDASGSTNQSQVEVAVHGSYCQVRFYASPQVQ